MNDRNVEPASAEPVPGPAARSMAQAHRPSQGGQTGNDIVNSVALMRGARTLSINHNGEIYRLQSTRTGKLILTK